MPYFAEIDDSYQVVRVIVAPSLSWCRQRLGGTWVETDDPYDDDTATTYAGIGVHHNPANPKKFQPDAPSITYPPTDGSDGSAVLQALIDAMSDGSCLLIPPGNYRIDYGITVDGTDKTIQGADPHNKPNFYTDLTGVELDPPVTQIRYPDISARAHWSVNGTGNTLRDLRVTGPNDYRDDAGFSRLNGLYYAEHAWSALGGSGHVFDRLECDSVYGDGHYLTGKVDDVTITDSRVTSCGRHGIAAVRASNVKVDGFTLVKGGTTGVDLEPNGADDYVIGFSLINFDIQPRTVPLVALGVHEVSDVLFENGVVRSGHSSWPTVTTTRKDGGINRNWTVRDVTRAYGGFPHLVLGFSNIDGVTVENFDASAIADKRNEGGVSFANATGKVSVTGCDFGASIDLFYPGSQTEGIVHWGNVWRGGDSNDGTERSVRGPVPRSQTPRARL